MNPDCSIEIMWDTTLSNLEERSLDKILTSEFSKDIGR